MAEDPPSSTVRRMQETHVTETLVTTQRASDYTETCGGRLQEHLLRPLAEGLSTTQAFATARRSMGALAATNS